jgi:hypothetical protein
VFRIDGARELAAGIAGAELVELAGTDHFLFTDADPVLDVVERFLSSETAPEPRATVLTTLVAIAAPGGPTVAPDAVALAWEQVGSGPATSPTSVAVDGAVVIAVDGPARAVRLARRLLDDHGADGWRAGVHTAEVELIGDRPTGTGLAIGLAVAAQAGPGEVLVTRTVTDLVAGSGLDFRYHGAVDVAELPGRWELYAPVDDDRS